MAGFLLQGLLLKVDAYHNIMLGSVYRSVGKLNATIEIYHF